MDHCALAKMTLKQRTLNSLSFSLMVVQSVFMLTILALHSSSTLFMIMPTLLISLCLDTSSTCSFSASSFLICSTVLSTLTWNTPLNLLYSVMGDTSFVFFDIALYQYIDRHLGHLYSNNTFSHHHILKRLLFANIPRFPDFKYYIRQMNQQKKIKLIISSLKEKELIQFFEIYSDYHLPNLSKNVKKISFNCYEATFQYKQTTVNGYGKNYNQAFASAIQNFLDKLLENEKSHNGIRDCLKKYSQIFNIPNMQQPPSQKMKTLPGSSHDKKIGCVLKTQDCILKPKDNMIKSVKTLKQEIFQSLNHDNIQIKPVFTNSTQLHKNSSQSLLNQQTRNQQLSSLHQKIKQLQEQLSNAEEQNQYLKTRLKQKESSKELTHASSSSKLDKYHVPEPKTHDRDAHLKDISNKFNNTSNTQDIVKDQTKMRSYSLSNSINPSAFNSKATPKVKIPKLNLQILPNYHGKSNKSLNQSLLDAYEKKTKGSHVNI